MEQAPVVLACDVGNSTIHFARVQGEDVSPMRTASCDDGDAIRASLDELWADGPEPAVLAAASVNPAGLKALRNAAEATSRKVLVVGQDLPLPIATDLADPQTVGTDRLCCASSAYDRLGTACVVADFGTAITIDCVNDSGVFLGGAILPGLRMGAKALQSSTAQLPSVELADPDWTFGKDTDQAIVGGLVRGARGALREFAEAYATELGQWPTVVITGGDAGLICPRVEQGSLVQAVVEDLVLRGVAMSYYRSLLK